MRTLGSETWEVSTNSTLGWHPIEKTNKVSKNNLPEKLFMLPLFSSIVSRLSLFVLSRRTYLHSLRGASAYQVQVQVSGPAQ